MCLNWCPASVTWWKEIRDLKEATWGLCLNQWPAGSCSALSRVLILCPHVKTVADFDSLRRWGFRSCWKFSNDLFTTLQIANVPVPVLLLRWLKLSTNQWSPCNTPNWGLNLFFFFFYLLYVLSGSHPMYYLTFVWLLAPFSSSNHQNAVYSAPPSCSPQALCPQAKLICCQSTLLIYTLGPVITLVSHCRLFRQRDTEV